MKNCIKGGSIRKLRITALKPCLGTRSFLQSLPGLPP